jgi:hypothetical protein
MFAGVNIALGSFVPSLLQVVYSFIVALLVALFWCKEQLGYALTSAGSEESVATFQELIKQFVDRFTNNDVIGSISVGLVWAVVGMFILAFVYETVNIFIALRNEKMIATTFTHADEHKKALMHTAEVRAALTVGFLIFVFVALAVFIPFWQSLISQQKEVFFQLSSVLKEFIGLIGLMATICLLWRWALVLFPKFI